ncbi:metallophosphoesterase [Candidatus Woesearchaeota archaeon]|nr:metallophosphoesterase [Candidatus Woesearchaeota archaeon]
MVKIFATGDFHSDSRLTARLAEKASQEKVDLVVITGDITHQEMSTEGLIGPFVKKNKKVALIPGNHESFATADFLSQFYGATNLHGYSLRIGDLAFFGCGGANCGLNQLTEEEIFETLARAYTQIKDVKKKIMVTHVHPSGTLMEKFSHYVKGSTGVRKAIQTFQPEILLCSHVHEAEGVEEKIGKTTVINVGKKGKVLEL